MAVQAGVPPDAVLLLGRQAQTARLQAMGLLQDLSGLMRQARRRFGALPRVTEQWHVVAGTWFAVPYYQRLVGHWVRAAALRGAGLDPGRDFFWQWDRMRDALGALAAPEQGYWPWGIGTAPTADTDAWCWNVINSFGGGLANQRGERVTLASRETVAAVEWLAETVRALTARQALPPPSAAWTDAEKNAAFRAGITGYTFSDRLLGGDTDTGVSPRPVGDGASPGVPRAGDAVRDLEAVYLRAPEGPVARVPATSGGAVWYVPRGAPAEMVERLLEALLEPRAQQAIWAPGGAFALPAYEAGWQDPSLQGLPGGANARRFREELRSGAATADGNAGPPAPAAQATADLRLAAGMLRAALAGRSARDAVAGAAQQAEQLFRDFGLPRA